MLQGFFVNSSAAYLKLMFHFVDLDHKIIGDGEFCWCTSYPQKLCLGIFKRLPPKSTASVARNIYYNCGLLQSMYPAICPHFLIVFCIFTPSVIELWNFVRWPLMVIGNDRVERPPARRGVNEKGQTFYSIFKQSNWHRASNVTG